MCHSLRVGHYPGSWSHINWVHLCPSSCSNSIWNWSSQSSAHHQTSHNSGGEINSSVLHKRIIILQYPVGQLLGTAPPTVLSSRHVCGSWFLLVTYIHQLFSKPWLSSNNVYFMNHPIMLTVSSPPLCEQVWCVKLSLLPGNWNLTPLLLITRADKKHSSLLEK